MLIIVFIHHSLCQTRDGLNDTIAILYVTPTTNISCPGEPCLTLSQYSHDQDTYFSTNAELHFLPGVHQLNEQVTLKGRVDFTMFAFIGREPGQSIVVSAEQAALKLAGIKTIRIESLQFYSNNDLNISNTDSLVAINMLFTSINASGFTFENIDSIAATNITISNSLHASSTGIVRLSNGIFSNLTVVNNSGDSVITIDQSSIQFRDVNIFEKNTAKEQSSLLVVASIVTFTGVTEFIQNKCEKKGGSMSIINSTVALRDQLELNGNIAKDRGGAIHLTHSVLVLQGSIDVIDNSVSDTSDQNLAFGGAISSTESIVTISGTVTFSSNFIVLQSVSLSCGGAISASTSTLILSGIMTFHHNYVRGFLSYGGAILLSNSSLVATDINFTFTENSALNGGAIALTGQLSLWSNHLLVSTSLSVKGNTLFKSNQAEAVAGGGGLYGDSNVDITFIGNTTFDRNGENQAAIIQVARGHCQVLFSGWTEIKGGYSSHCTFTRGTVTINNSVQMVFNGTTRFVDNTCSIGIVQVFNHASLVVLGHIHFLRNHGGTLVLHDSNLSLNSEQAIFQDNESGIIAQSSVVKLEGDIQFTHNHGTSCINILQSNVTINGAVTMTSNSAISGPAINSISSMVHMYGDYQFSNNTASGDGGSIFAIRSEIYFYGHTFTFLSNKASRGGVMYTIDSHLYFSGHHNFMTNNADTGGVITMGFNSLIHFKNLNMSCINNS